MPVEKTVTSIVHATPPEEHVTINFSDGSGVQYGTMQDIKALAQSIENEDGWMRLWCAYWYSRDPDFSNETIAMGRFTLDAGAANLFRKQ